MKLVTISDLSTREEYEIGKFLGIRLFTYVNVIMGRRFIYKEVNPETDYFDCILTKDYGDEFYEWGKDGDDLYSFDIEDLRFREDFIEYIETHRDIFSNVKIHDIEEGKPFIIRIDDEMGVERLELLENLNVRTVRNGKVEIGF